MSKPLLTIAVPFYKGLPYLRRAVESIFMQPRSSWVALLVDNSTDAEESDGARALAASYPAELMRYVKNDAHLSGSDNFNRCINLAETDLVSTLHNDDEVLPCYSQEVLGLAARHPDAAILFIAVSIIDKNSKKCFSFIDWFKQFLRPRSNGDVVLSGEPALRSLLRGNWINGAAICYRKSLLGDLRWDDVYKATNDLELWSRAILSGRKMAGTTRPPAYLYRRHSGQITEQFNASLERFHTESWVLDVIAERAHAAGWRSAAAMGRRKTILQLQLCFMAMQDLARGAGGRAWAKLRLVHLIRSGR